MSFIIYRKIFLDIRYLDSHLLNNHHPNSRHPNIHLHSAVPKPKNREYYHKTNVLKFLHYGYRYYNTGNQNRHLLMIYVANYIHKHNVGKYSYYNICKWIIRLNGSGFYKPNTRIEFYHTFWKCVPCLPYSLQMGARFHVR